VGGVVGMAGTGRWTIQEAAERNVPASTIAAALDSRYLRSGPHNRTLDTFTVTSSDFSA
jgi:6-phosphogluconate dehydrogenase (decarboxylating)